MSLPCSRWDFAAIDRRGTNPGGSNWLTEPRAHSYNTTSNLTRVVKTPGGSLRLLHIKKRGTAPKCGDCGIKLPGVSWFAFRVLQVGEGEAWEGEGRSRPTEHATNRYRLCAVGNSTKTRLELLGGGRGPDTARLPGS